MPEGSAQLIRLSAVARQRFKEALLDGRIKTGAVLTQAELVAILGVPIGALRDAMQVLESEGLLTIMPRSGIQIVKPDLETLRDAFQFRRIIEAEATRKYTAYASDEEMARWQGEHQAVLDEARMNGPDPALTSRAIDVDWQFHQALVSHLRNSLVSAAYNRTMELLNIIRIDSRYALPRYALVPSMREHLAILAAMQARNGDEAAQQMEQHLAGAMHRAMGL